MQKTNKLRASNSEQWTNCAGSVKAQEGLPDIQSSFAKEGQFAHEIAAFALMNNISPDDMLNKGGFIVNGIIDTTLQRAVSKYIEYIQVVCNKPTSVFVEQNFDISHITLEENATVTPDFVCIHSVDGNGISNYEVDIVDLKYGTGVKVHAYQNTQLLLYALAIVKFQEDNLLLQSFLGLQDPVNIVFRLHIVQPRLNHYDKWSVTKIELEEWAKYFQDKAKLALDPNAIRTPHEKACRWCKAKPNCPALYDLTHDVVLQKVNKTNLTETDIKTILDNRKLIIDFINNIEERVYKDLSEGKEFKGYYLKPGNSIRKLREDCLQEFIEFLGENAFEKKVIGISKAKELLDKAMIEKFFEHHPNKPILEKRND